MEVFTPPAIGSHFVGFKGPQTPDNTFTFKRFTVVGYVPMMCAFEIGVRQMQGLHLQDEEKVDYYQAGNWLQDQQIWFYRVCPTGCAGPSVIQTKDGSDIWLTQ